MAKDNEQEPGMKYSIFSCALYDEDNDSAHKESLLDKDIGLEKLIVKYEMSSIPVVEIHISIPLVYERFANLKNVHIDITVSSVQKPYDIGIIDKVAKPNDSGKTLLIMYGFLCKYDDIMNIESSYLGDSFINTVKSLNVKPNIKINGKNGFSEEFSSDFSRDYWQIQESKIQVLHRVLQQAYEQSIYSMDNDTIYINTLDYSTDDKDATYQGLIPTSYEYASKTERLSYLLQSTTCIKNLDDEKSDLSMNTSFGKSLIDERNSTAMVNYMKSYPLFMYQGDILVKCFFENRIPQIQLGESTTKINGVITSTSNWYAIEKIERFSSSKGVTTCILFSAV